MISQTIYPELVRDGSRERMETSTEGPFFLIVNIFLVDGYLLPDLLGNQTAMGKSSNQMLSAFL